ncbi:MAG: substrate-binding domain-containing protein [Oscillospiraceae bacterium]|nr:substrate-binding domain-containing protein [Oscillospiraceae bacterium]
MQFQGKKRPVFGVVAAQAADIEQRQILLGIIENAKSCGVDIVILTNIYNPYYPDDAFSCENKIYDLIDSPDLDGFIYIAESILNSELRVIIKNKLLDHKEKPVVIIGTVTKDFECGDFCFINTSETDDIMDITDHLIEVHGFTDIDIISGPEEVEAARQRVEGYKKSLLKHFIEFDSSKVHYGNFWITSGHDLASKYINGQLRLPQAVICTNDYMAYGLLDEFADHNIRVPDDVTVAGYEYVRQRLYHYPVLTTYQRNRENLGRAAFRFVNSKTVPGIKQEQPLSLRGRVINGCSCSCGINTEEYNRELTQVRHDQFYQSLDLSGQFEQKLTECRTMREYISVCRENSYLIRSACGIYLCLFENWCSFSNSGEEASDIMNCYIVKDKYKKEDKQFLINGLDFVSLFADCPESCAYYINPVFFSKRYMGYFILVYDSPDTYDYIYRNWLKTASNALELLRMKNDISYLSKCQSLSLIHDSVTGIYNRKGFEYAVCSCATSVNNSGEILTVMVRTELFSENLQFDKQDKRYTVSCEAAAAVKKLVGYDNEFCGRLASNLFVFAGFRKYSADYGEILIDKLRTLIIHSPSYIRECGLNSFVCTYGLYSTENFSCDSMINDMIADLNEKSKIRTYEISLPHFSDFMKIRNQIYTQPEEEYSSDDICQQLCLSVGYFRNSYKKYFGVSFHKDCILSRMSLAKYLLISTSMSITAVAQKCGYDDEKYFMRLFQKNTSLTPNKYRSMQQTVK